MRPSPLLVAKRRPVAPDINAEPATPVSAPEGKSLFVKVMSAVIPSGAEPVSASSIAAASGFGGGVAPPDPVAATASAALPEASATTTAIRAIRRGVESVRSSFTMILSRVLPLLLYRRDLQGL